MSNYFGFMSGGGSAGGGLTYKGTWDALLNIPALASGVGVNGDYYIVNVAGNTNLDGITDWAIGDWAIFDGTAWQKIDNSDVGIVSLNGLTTTTQSFSTGTAGLDFNISSLLSTHTFNLPDSSSTQRGALTSADWTTFNSKQNPITLTTVGTSGASTLIANTLNIPQYAGASANVRTATFGCTANGGGFAPLTGIIGYTVIPYNGTITGWNIVSDVSGSCVIDIWKANGVVPTVANTICAGSKPTLSSQQLNSDTILLGWTISVVAGDVIGFNLDSASTLTSVNLIITILKT